MVREVNDMSIRQLIGSAFALTFLVSVFACTPDVNDLDDPPRAHFLAQALIVEYRTNPVRFVRDRVGTQFQAHGEVVGVGFDGAVMFSGGWWRGAYLECRFRDPNTPALVNPHDKIAVTGTVDSVELLGTDSVELLGKDGPVLHMVDCELDAGG